MQLLNQVRYKLINKLWNNYVNETTDARGVHHILLKKKKNIVLDHFAIIDLPSKNTGIDTLSQIFSCLGFIIQGRDYLPEKQNEFLWMVEQDAYSKPADTVLPQAVLSDFRLNELPISIRKIITKYTAQIKTTPLPDIKRLTKKASLGDSTAASKLLSLLLDYFKGRDWELPTLSDFKAVHEANELLGWVLLFGRKPNHFTISVHLLGEFKELIEFHTFLTENVKCLFNEQGSTIKGSRQEGIMQSSTMPGLVKVELADGNTMVRDRFIEFIWRYAKDEQIESTLWNNFHTGFMAKNANQVIESLYQ